jgi:3-oxoacyl-[acyl-carrier-protein] synthase II
MQNFGGALRSMRIVVTGLGAISPLGCGVENVWSRLLAGQSGLRRVSSGFAPDVASQVVGLVPDADQPGGFDLDRTVGVKDQKKMDRFIQFALAAADEAIGQAGWHPSEDRMKERTDFIP